MKQDREALIATLNRYSWYHRIEVAPDVYTPSSVPEYQRIWDFIFEQISAVDYSGKKVLDVGCRDGLFSFAAERRGASEVIGIDNNVSAGAVEVLIPYFESAVEIHSLNLYDLTPGRFGKFDIIQFFGVLYHLRYPFWGLKKLFDCVADNGLLIVESGMLSDRFQPADQELLYCPVERSPYEPSSCTFFNATALITTMRSLGGVFLRRSEMPNSSCVGVTSGVEVVRQLHCFKRTPEAATPEILEMYWDRTHQIHGTWPTTAETIDSEA